MVPASSDCHSAHRRQLISGLPSTPSEVSIAYIDISPSSSSSSSPKGTILLIHGYPETSHQFHKVIPLFLAHGYRVIAPDYRGAGHSSKPRDGYEKTTVAADLHTLLHEHLGVTSKSNVHVVGHDIGGMVAHAYASRFPDDVASVLWGECPLPGTKVYEEFKHTPGVWHFTFHWQTELPEQLVTGREAVYLRHFYDRLCYNPQGIGREDVEEYAWHFSQPGALRAGFDLYRAFHQDAEENAAWVKDKGKCKVRCGTLNGDHSFLKDIACKQAEEMYEKVEAELQVKDSGHWCAEENPESFVEQVLSFIEKS